MRASTLIRITPFLTLAALLAACGSGSSLRGDDVSEETIEQCWQKAGLTGDIYKFMTPAFMTPAEARGLQSVGGASSDQVAAFKACITAPAQSG